MINQTGSFTYLGTLITEEGRCTKETNYRIAQTKTAFNNFKNILTNKKLPFKTRFRVLCCYVWPVLLYVCEAWTLHCETKKLLEMVKTWYLKGMERISYTAHKTNEFIQSKTQKTRMLSKIIEHRQLKFFGHVIRKEELEKTILSGHINGKRNKGRHRKTYVDGISEKVRKSNRVHPSCEEKRRVETFMESETRQGTLKKKNYSVWVSVKLTFSICIIMHGQILI